MSVDNAVKDLLARLEKVTARLETVEKELASGARGAPAAGAPAGASAASAGGDVSSPSADGYQRLIDEFIVPYVAHSNALGGEVAAQAASVLTAVNAQKHFLVVASQSKKPDDATLQALIADTAKAMGAVSEIREKNRASKQFSNLSTVSEGISALGWVVVAPTPGPHINEAKGSSEFYSNKLLTAHKNSDKPEDKLQVSWVQSWNGFLKELFVYVKQFHTTGVTWNPRGGDAASFKGAAAPAAAAAAAPAKPAEAARPTPAAAPAAAKKGAGLFAEINAVGEGQKPTLKKVTKDMKTSNQEGKSSVVKATTKAAGPVKEGKLQLNGNKWEVEHQVGIQQLVISETEPKHVIYLYKCERTTVQVKGKINNITLDSCKRVSLVFDTAIAAVEAVNCQNLEIQCTGSCPTYTVDSSSGFQLFLGSTGLVFELTQSKSSEINVMIPGQTADADMIELNIPDQFCSSIKDSKLITNPVQHV